MIRRGLLLLVALVISGAPAALQMCGSHCVTAVSCHEATATGAQSSVKAGPHLCPHAVALGAVMGIKSAAPRPTIDVAAVATAASHFAPSGVSTSAGSMDQVPSLPIHTLVQQLRI